MTTDFITELYSNPDYSHNIGVIDYQPPHSARLESNQVPLVKGIPGGPSLNKI